MRSLTRCLSIILLACSLGPAVAHAQQQQTHAVPGDTVWVILNHVKPDKVEQFETFIYQYLQPALEAQKPEWLVNVRFLLPAAQNEDGTYTYTFIMDPKQYPSYRMILALEPAYGKEKAEAYLGLFTESLKNGEQVGYFQIESGWKR